MSKKNIKDDYDYSRETYYDLLEKGKQSLELMIEVARESEHPRAFEVLSGMIKNVGEISDSLMDLHKKKKDYDKVEEPKELPGTTNNNVFIGSTSDLQRMLHQQDNEEKVVDISDFKKDD